MDDFKNKIKDKIQFDIADSEDINKPNKNGVYLIYAILNSSNPDLLVDGIKNGLNVNQDLGDGWTPIHEAIDYAIDSMIQSNLDLPYPETLEFIKILINNGASLDAFYKDGHKPLDALNTYSASIDTFNHLKNILRTTIPDIDVKIRFIKDKTT